VKILASKEDAEDILEELHFVAGKAGISLNAAVEIIKINLLEAILKRLEENQHKQDEQ